MFAWPIDWEKHHWWVIREERYQTEAAAVAQRVKVEENLRVLVRLLLLPDTTTTVGNQWQPVALILSCVVGCDWYYFFRSPEPRNGTKRKDTTAIRGHLFTSSPRVAACPRLLGRGATTASPRMDKIYSRIRWRRTMERMTLALLLSKPRTLRQATTLILQHRPEARGVKA